MIRRSRLHRKLFIRPRSPLSAAEKPSRCFRRNRNVDPHRRGANSSSVPDSPSARACFTPSTCQDTHVEEVEEYVEHDASAPHHSDMFHYFPAVTPIRRVIGPARPLSGGSHQCRIAKSGALQQRGAQKQRGRELAPLAQLSEGP